ncbi:MAG: GNAT family N-acetyltransferase [Candidatus Nanoarchaeia archaeon]|nr:GNAT family N-acetyltransferase [Candidatus Nanoarchaeia archaeon]
MERAILESERLILRPVKLSDADAVYEHAKHRVISRYTSNIPYPYPKESAKPFLRKCLKKLKDNEEYTFAMVPKNKKTLIGIVSLHLKWENKRAELGYWLGKKYWGNGYMPETVKTILDFGFNKLKLNKIYARAFVVNSASKRVLEKSGFKKEGTLQQHYFKNGRFYDAYSFSITKSQYKTKNKK